MLRRLLGSLMLLAATAAPLVAQSTDVKLAVVELFDSQKEQLTYRSQVTENVAQEVTVTVVMNGVQRLEKRIVYVPVFREELRVLSLRDHSVFVGEGKPLPPDELKQRLEKGTPILIGGKELLRTEYRKLLRPDAILLIAQRTPMAVPVPLPEPKKLPPMKDGK